MPVYAAATASISGGYLYIPISSGCPQIKTLYATYYQIWYADEDSWYSHWGSYLSSYYAATSPSRAPSTGHNSGYGGDYRMGDWDTGYRVIFWYSDNYWCWNHYDDSAVYEYQNHYVIVSGAPEISGNYIRYRVGGSLTTRGCGAGSVLSTSSSVPGSVSVDTNGAHSFAITSNATCTTAATQKCSKCGASGLSGSALGHSYTVKQTNATCTTNQVNKCSRCSSTSQIANTALGHDWDSGTPTPDATPYTTGVMTYTCQRDGSHQRTEVIPQKHFQIYHNDSRINKIYLGNTLIINVSDGNDTLVK